MSAEFRKTMDALLAGQEDAAWQLIQTYGPHVERAIRRRKNHSLRSKFNTSDFVQMVWQSFFADRSEFARLKTPEQLVRFLVTVARNKVVDETRRQLNTQKNDVRREESISRPEADIELSGGEPLPDQVAMIRECWRKLLEGQSQQNQNIVRLRLEGRTYLEIADSVGVHERTARKVIEQLLDDHGESVRRTDRAS